MAQSILYPNDLHTLITALHGTKLLLLGEVHGVKENVHIIESLIRELPQTETRPLVLAFEWLLSPAEINHLNSYIHAETNTFPNAPFFSDSDGRYIETHRELFETLRHNGIRREITIETFDTSADPAYEHALAHNLVEVCRKHEKALIIAETGVVHAGKKLFCDLDGNMSKSMALYIPDTIQTTSVFIRYMSGEVVVEGETHPITHASSQIEGPGDGFDFELCVECAHPADSLA